MSAANVTVKTIRFVIAAALTIILTGRAHSDETTVDVAVVGATPSGISAAVAAARCGRTVALVEWENHIGGILTNGLTNSDIGNKQAVGGLFYEFTRRVLRHYQERKSDNPAYDNVTLCRNGYWYEASVAEKIFHEMIAEQQGRIQLFLSHELRDAELDGSRLAEIRVQARNSQDGLRVIKASVFVDATYEGDLAAKSQVPYRIGRESRDEYGETHAGKVYVRFGTKQLLPGSTGEADKAIQGFCFRFHATKDPAIRVAIEKPTDYQRDDYTALLADIRSRRITKLTQAIQFYPMPNGHFEINSDHPHTDTGVPSESLDLTEENWQWPESTPADRQRIYQRILTHNVGLIWLLQNDPEVPVAIRDEANQWGWCQDLWPENRHLPRQVYVREGRRIVGEYTVTQQDGDVDPTLQRTRLQATSIAVVEFAFDSHGCHKFDPSHPGVREGYIYIEHPPLQVPYGVLVPKTVDALLVPVACSASHVGYNAMRMEPVFMALGEASGVAAHLAITRQLPARDIPVAELQHRLVAQRCVITHWNDVPFDHKAFAALQWLGARGFQQGYRAMPDKPITCRDAAERLQRVFACERIAWTQPELIPTGNLRGREAKQWLSQVRNLAVDRVAWAPDGDELTTSQFAILLYHVLKVSSIPHSAR